VSNGVLFVGAGASTHIGVPSLSEMTDIIIGKLGEEKEPYKLLTSKDEL